MSNEQLFDTDMAIVTIVVDNGEIKVDLGSLHPSMAIVVLDNISRSLKDCLVPPRVTYEGHVIIDSGDFDDEDEG